MSDNSPILSPVGVHMGIIRLTSVAVGAVLCAFAGAVSASVEYSITDLGNFNATAMNNNGQIVGWAETNVGMEAVLYDSGILTTLSGPGSEALAINNSGEAVGWATFAEPYYESETVSVIHAALFEGGGSVDDLGSIVSDYDPDWTGGYATGINDSGAIVGYSAWLQYFDYGNSGEFLWENNKLIYLGPLAPTAINDAGEIVGVVNGYAYSSTVGYLGSLGGTWSAATAINSTGEIVGQAALNGDTVAHAFLYSNGEMIDIDASDPSNSIANSINSNGQVVGVGEFPFIYSDGDTDNLSDLVPANSGWTLNTAVAINDEGQIVGNGINPDGQPDAFLLTPVPEPASFSLLAFAGFALSLRRSVAKSNTARPA